MPSAMMAVMNETVSLQDMDEVQLRQMVQRLMGEVKHKQALLDKLTHEMAILKRLKFAAKAEALHAEQRSLLQEALEEDLQAVDEEIQQMQPPEQRSERAKAKRLPLPAQLPRQEFKHEPEATECCGQPMKRIGEDVAEKLDYATSAVGRSMAMVGNAENSLSQSNPNFTRRFDAFCLLHPNRRQVMQRDKQTVKWGD